MRDSELNEMSLDDLWDLHERVGAILSDKIENEKKKLEQQLNQLARRGFGIIAARSGAPTIPEGRGEVSKPGQPVRDVVGTRQNPALASQTDCDWKKDR